MKLSNILFKTIDYVVLIAFIGALLSPLPAYAQADLTIIHSIDNQNLSATFPIDLKGLSVHPDNPSQLDFILDSTKSFSNKDIKQEAGRFFKYFLAALTIPQDDIWVNLSPYEHNLMIPFHFGYTEMGRDFLIEDYALKQLTASLIYPESSLGKEFWNKVYQKTYQLYGTTHVSINTFNKVWIIPDKPAVYVHGHDVFVIHNHLKVLSEQDFLASSKYFNSKNGNVPKDTKAGNSLNTLSADIVKKIVIPEIERQVNGSPDFLKLRQIYQAMILATWYKKNLRDNILGKIYLDQNKVLGIDIKDRLEKEKIYHQYLSIFKKGVFNFVREDYDIYSKQSFPRKYFSGGLRGVKEVTEKSDLAMLDPQERQELPSRRALEVTASLLGAVDKATVSNDPGAVTNKINPYGVDVNITRDCFMGLDPAYDIFKVLDRRSKEKLKMLLIGVGRGVSAIELALRYPHIEIWAVNKEDNLWDDNIIGQIMRSKGYDNKQISEARSRTKVLAFDAANENQRDSQLGNNKFDMVFFEPRTQIYFEDKIGPIEGFFNRYVNAGGEYGFVSNGIFTSDEAFHASDFGSPFYERNPDPEAVALIKKVFSSKSELRFWNKIGGNLYFRFRRTSDGDVRIPLKKVRNERFITPEGSPLVPAGLPLIWSIYQPNEDVHVEASPEDKMIISATATYSSESEFFDDLMLSAHPYSTIPILLLAGDPGSGKTTLAEKYKAHLEADGRKAIIINTDKLFNINALMLKQAFLSQWLKIPLIPAITRMKVFNKLLVDSDRVNGIAQQIRDINASEHKAGVIHIDGLPEMAVSPQTVIILEGSLADLMFGEQLPITKKVYCRIAPGLQKQRIITRAVENRGYSLLKAKVAARLLSATAFKTIFESGFENYDAAIETNEEGQSKIVLKDYAQGANDIKQMSYSYQSESVRSVDSGKYYIDGSIVDSDGFASAVHRIAAALSVDQGNYFNIKRNVRVAIGFDGDGLSEEYALKMSRILAAYKIAVSLVDEQSQPYMLAELTRTDQPAKNKYDLAFHISRDSHEFYIRPFEKGGTAYELFLDFLYSKFDFGEENNQYREYKDTSRIPRQLFRRLKIGDKLKKRYAVFDIKSLKKEIPGFLKAMRKKGIVNIDAVAIERLLSSYGFDDQRIGSLDLNFNAEGATQQNITDIDGSSLEFVSLAIVFIKYLHSIGQSGDIVKSARVSSAIDRLAHQLGIPVDTVMSGIAGLSRDPKSLLGLLSNGHIIFNYLNERFISSPAAERLLALEIMLKKKMTLHEYLNSINSKDERTRNAQTSLRSSTIINGDKYQMLVPFGAFRGALLHEDGFNLGVGIAVKMGFTPRDVAIQINKDDHNSSFVVNFVFLNRNKITIKGEYSTSEQDTLRLYAETPANIDPEQAITATQKTLFELLGNRNYHVNGNSPSPQIDISSLSSNALSGILDVIKSMIQGRYPGTSIHIVDIDDIDDIRNPDTGDETDQQDSAMKSYGGISFQSQFMDVEVQGDAVSLNLTPRQRFRSNAIDGIVPIVTSVKAYSFSIDVASEVSAGKG